MTYSETSASSWGSHPQANGQVKVTNQSLLKIIKTQLEEAKGIWPDELPSVLWAYKMTARTPIGETPFCLAFGSKAIIPEEVVLDRIAHHDEGKNEERIRLPLDLLNEVRTTAK